MENLGYSTGKTIAKERIELQLNQDQLGEKIGVITGKYVKRQTISNWEKGLTTPNLKQLKALSQIFDCDIYYLLGDTHFKRIGSAEIHEIIRLSPAACDILITAAKENNPIISLLSDFIEDSKESSSAFDNRENVLELIGIASLLNYGTGSAAHCATFYDAFTGKESAFYISPRDIYRKALSDIHNAIDSFITKQRKKRKLPDYD